MNIETASLVLRTFDLTKNDNRPKPTNYSTKVGSANAKRTRFTWNNINLRVLLGTMYDKYDLFNLVLKSVSSGTPIGAIGEADQLNTVICCSGLPFINQTYNFVTDGFGATSYTTLETYQFNASSYDSLFIDFKDYEHSRLAVFGKSQELCNLSLFYQTCVYGNDPVVKKKQIEELDEDDEPVTDDNGDPVMVDGPDDMFFPEMIFIFEIFGIPKEEGNKNGTRLNINSANSFGM